MGFLARFDIFPKAYESEARVRTSLGGLLSLLTIAFLIFNIAKEVQEYYHETTLTKMAVFQQDLPPMIPFELDMYVYNDCSRLHLDFTNFRKTSELEATISKKDFQQIENFCYIQAAGHFPSVPGSFHIGLGRNYVTAKGEHKHQTIEIQNHNLSHRIDYIKIGTNSPKSPIDRTNITLPNPKPYMLIYNLQLIPVTHESGTSFQILADLVKTNMEKVRTKGFEGIVFDWSFSPLELHKAKQSTPLITLVSHLLGLFGSFFVFIRWIDSFSYAIEKRIFKKNK